MPRDVIGVLPIGEDPGDARIGDQERFRIVADFTYDWEQWLGPEGRYLYVSPSCERITGYRPEEFLQDPDLLLRITHTQDRATVAHHHDLELGGPAESGLEFRIITRAGEERWIDHRCQPAYGADGTWLGQRGSNRDVTDRKRAESAAAAALEAQGASEATYRALVEGLPDVVMRFDRDGRHLFVSANVEEVVDLPAEQFIGKTHRELGFAEADCRFWEEAICRVCDTGTAIETEFSVETKRGTVTFEWRLLPERDAQGVVRSALSLSRDVTAHRRAERDYQTLFREMLDGFALHEILCDEEGRPVDYRFLAINPAFERLTGLKAGDVVGQTVLGILPGIEPAWVEIYGRVALTGEPVFFESYAAGLDKHFQVTAFRPAPNQFACIFADITAHKRAEEALRESQLLLDATQRLSRVGGWQWDVEKQAMWWTREAYHIHDLVPGEIEPGSAEHVARSLDCYEPDAQSIVLSAFQRCVAAGEPYDLELPFTTALGRRLWVRTMGRAEREGERTVRVVGNIMDITARKNAEIEQEKLQEQLAQALKMESIGRLAGGIAHDFNNMLGVIIGHTELTLQQIEPASELYANLEEIRQAAQRSADLTRQLLAFARKQMVSPRVLDLNITIGGMLTMLGRLIGEAIELAWIPGQELWPVKIDPGQLDQVLVNLCVNARDAMAGAGRITMQTSNVVAGELGDATVSLAPGEYVLLAVSDTGCGMDSEVLAHLFEPYYTTKSVGQGTGLGLATVYGAVQMGQGVIDVDSEPGRGTTFRIYWPRSAGQALHPMPQTASMQGGRETVLMVEDEPAILRLGRAVLEQLGYNVLTAGRPGEALLLARANAGEIHLLITDVVMPEMNGPVLAAAIAPLNPGLRCLFISGYTADMIARRDLLEHGAAFLQKPFTLAELAAKVREVLAQGGEHAA